MWSGVVFYYPDRHTNRHSQRRVCAVSFTIMHEHSAEWIVSKKTVMLLMTYPQPPHMPETYGAGDQAAFQGCGDLSSSGASGKEEGG